MEPTSQSCREIIESGLARLKSAKYLCSGALLVAVIVFVLFFALDKPPALAPIYQLSFLLWGVGVIGGF